MGTFRPVQISSIFNWTHIFAYAGYVRTLPRHKIPILLEFCVLVHGQFGHKKRRKKNVSNGGVYHSIEV